MSWRGKHGIWGYRQGCKCGECRAANLARRTVTCRVCGEQKMRRGRTPRPPRICGFCIGELTYFWNLPHA
jgi:hypothetical protein